MVGAHFFISIFLSAFKDADENAGIAKKALEAFLGTLDKTKTSITSTGTSIKSLGSNLASFIASNWAAVAAVAAVSAALVAFNYSQHEYTRNLEAAEEAVAAYEEQKSALEDMQSEYDDVQAQIEELKQLQTDGTITLEQEIELENLEAQNETLSAQIELYKALTEAQQEAAIAATDKAANTEQSYMEAMQEEYGTIMGFFMGLGGYLGTYTDIDGTITSVAAQWDALDTSLTGRTESAIERVQTYNDQIAELDEQIAANTTDSALDEKLQAERASIVENKAEALSELADYEATIEEWIDTYTYDDGSIVAGHEDDVAYYKELLEDLATVDMSDLEKQLHEIDEFFSDSSNDGLSETFQDAIASGKDLDTILGELGISLSDIGEDVTAESLVEYFNDVEAAAEEVEEEATSVADTLATAFASAEETVEGLTTAMSESASATGLSADSITLVESAFEGLEGYDAAKLFEATTTGVHLNREALEALNAEYEASQKLQYQETLESLEAEYASLTEQLNETTWGTEEYNNILSDMSSIQDQINSVSLLQAEYEGLTSAYNKFLTAQSTTDEREAYETIGDSYETVEDLINQGWVSDREVDEYLDLLLAADERTQDNYADFQKLKETIEGTSYSIADFFQYDEDDNLVSTGLYNMLDSVKAILGEEYVTIDDGIYSFDWTGDKINDVADALGMSVEAVELLAQAMADAGFDVVFDGLVVDTEELETAIEESEEALRSMGATAQDAVEYLRDLGYLSDTSFNFEAEDIDDVNSQLKSAVSLLDEFKTGQVDASGNVVFDVEAEGYDETVAIITALMTQKQELEAPAVMSVDTTDATDDVTALIGNLQEYYSYANTLEIETTVHADTSDTEANMDSVIDKISQVPAEVLSTVIVDDGQLEEFQSALNTLNGTDGNGNEITVTAEMKQESIDTILATISSINLEDLDIDLDTTQVESAVTTIDNMTIADKSFDISATDKATSIVNSVNSLKIQDKTFTITTVKKTVTTASAANVNGTANINGTAYAMGSAFLGGTHGDWGVKGSGVGLIGEVGPEILVRNGQYYVMGEDSAEFFKYQPNDVIFNADQTEELLRTGQISSGNVRGTSFLEGSAFVSGSGGKRPTTTGTTTSASKKSSSSSSSSSSKSSSSSSSSSSSNSSSSSSSKKSSSSSSSSSSEAEAETLDWIEVLLERIEAQIESLDKTASSVYKNTTTRLNATRSEISAITNEIATQQSAYDYYMQKANSVNLSSYYKNLVQNGAIKIEDIKSESVQEAISEYTQWYEKALDCKTAIEDLNETLSSLYESMFEITETNYENVLATYEHRITTMQNSIELVEAEGYIASKKYYEYLETYEKQIISKLEAEQKALTESLQEALDSGTIAAQSEEWYFIMPFSLVIGWKLSI